MQQHVFPLRVYYEDTDLAGIVYYANYLKFIERARTEWVRNLGVDQTALKTDHGVVFAVRHITADYIRPARFDEALDVVTRLKSVSAARLVLKQDVCREGLILFKSSVTLVALSNAGRPVRLPAEFRHIEC